MVTARLPNNFRANFQGRTTSRTRSEVGKGFLSETDGKRPGGKVREMAELEFGLTGRQSAVGVSEGPESHCVGCCIGISDSAVGSNFP